MAKKSKSLIKAEYTAARVAFAMLGVLPRGVAITLCTWLMRALPFILTNLRRTGLRNLEIAFPEKSEAERRVILKGTMESLGRVLGELSQIHKYARARLAELID